MDDILEMYPATVNSLETVLSADIGASDTIINVENAAALGIIPPNLLVIGDDLPNAETVRVIAIDNNALTVERAFEGAAIPWSAGSFIARNHTAYDHNANIHNISALQAQIQQLGFSIRITFDPALSGRDFTVSSQNFSISGQVPESLSAYIVVPSGETAYMVAVGNYRRSVNVLQFFGIYSVHIDTVEMDLHNLTWGEIEEIVSSGNAAGYFNIGDEIDIQLTSGEILTMHIWGFSHDDLADGSGKAGVTIGMKDLMILTQRMHPSETGIVSFPASEIWAWLRDTLPELLPKDLRNIIKPVIKKHGGGSPGSIMELTMNAFIPAQEEITSDITGITPGQGELYSIFSDNASRIKRLSNGTGAANSWWTRSRAAGGALTQFRTIQANGESSGMPQNLQSGICFAFCI